MSGSDVLKPVSWCRQSLTVIAAAVLLSGCPVVRGPAGFWEKYRSEAIASQYSDQGPWGGERWVVWRADAPGAFTFRDARSFAETNGWKLRSARRYDTHSPFPLTDQSSERRAPRFLPRPSTVGVFETAWVREDPGTNEASPAFGYVQVSDDGRTMYVYHFWGNG